MMDIQSFFGAIIFVIIFCVILNYQIKNIVSEQIKPISDQVKDLNNYIRTKGL